MYYVFCGMYFFFALYGLVCCIVNLVRLIMHSETDGRYVVISVCENDAECAVRCAMAEYPDSEIVVVNKNSSAEAEEIIKRLSGEYERVHIIQG